MTAFSPREIVSELDRFIIGQADAKRAVAVALRNRWRRAQLPAELREEVYPKNILMIGPTGVGKTEISRRMAKIVGAPFIKVEATKFTEVGYVGRDVEAIIRDLVEAGLQLVRTQRREEVRAAAHQAAEERVIDALVKNEHASAATREHFRKKLRSGELDSQEIELELADPGPKAPMLELPGQAGMGGINIGDLLGQAMGRPRKKRKLTVAESHNLLVDEEADKLLDDDQLARAAIDAVEQNGVVFIDEIDKVCARGEARGADVSREGVQRDLLPLIEGAAVATKYGTVRTDHILFVASGAFHVSKPSDLLPELQGRLPIRVQLQPLGEADFVRILTETQNSLLKQSAALLETEGVTLSFPDDGVAALAKSAAEMNRSLENIGARRLHTIIEHVLADMSFRAPDLGPDDRDVVIDAAYVESRLAEIEQDQDLRRYML